MGLSQKYPSYRFGLVSRVAWETIPLIIFNYCMSCVVLEAGRSLWKDKNSLFAEAH